MIQISSFTTRAGRSIRDPSPAMLHLPACRAQCLIFQLLPPCFLFLAYMALNATFYLPPTNGRIREWRTWFRHMRLQLAPSLPVANVRWLADLSGDCHGTLTQLLVSASLRPQEHKCVANEHSDSIFQISNTTMWMQATYFACRPCKLWFRSTNASYRMRGNHYYTRVARPFVKG